MNMEIVQFSFKHQSATTLMFTFITYKTCFCSWYYYSYYNLVIPWYSLKYLGLPYAYNGIEIIW